METSNTEVLTQEFNARRPKYEALCDELKFSLTRRMDEAGIKWHTITARPKDLKSFLEKVDRKEYADPFSETEDLAGARIVCLFMLDLERTGDVISSMFEVLNREDKIAEGDVSAFGYMSHHYVCKLSDRYAGERYDAIKGLKFEIQVRTILMDAWANMSHYLSYKNEESIPKDLIKDFHALSGLLYVGDRQFESLFKASTRSAATAEDRVLRSSEIAESEVNADTIQALLARLYSDRSQASPEAISEFTLELRDKGYDNLTEVGKILQKNKEAAIQREKHTFAENSQAAKQVPDRKYNRVGLARAAFDAHDPEYKKYRHERRRRQNKMEKGAEAKPQT
ncbi:hypothetical protein [Streptomyces sp. SP17KL33]|uniref:hypothetical protein n=1 Tax=Streptomyces sp. SP17KL33 TaxID=3002534 RepID=UPI002E7A0B13|nr:hypothetical protein [Streptomyces sp. SP17KL33]MEE1834108.1 hypothetical protein [Streptomyces sp. SP17KL33]